MKVYDMKDLTELQEKLKDIVLLYEEKTSGRIDNKNQIKQFNALVRNEDIDEDLINFIIDATDEINTRHFEFVEHTTKTIKDITEITHVDIEKLKHLIDKLPKHHKEEDKETTPTKPAWYDFTKWNTSDAKFFLVVLLGAGVITAFVLNANNPDFYKTVSDVFSSTNTIEKGK